MSNNNRNTRSNSTKYGICTNMEPKQDGTMCSLCQKKEKQAIRSTKDFVCAECGAPLTEVTAPRPFPPKVLITILSIILLVAAIIIGIMKQKEDGETGVGDTVDTTGIEQLPPNDTIHDTIFLNDTTVLVIRDTIVDTIIKEVSPKKTNPSNWGTYNLGWGTYNGPMKDGKPHGEHGKVKVTSTHSIELGGTNNKTITVYSGETIVTKYENGHLRAGEVLNRKNGLFSIF